MSSSGFDTRLAEIQSHPDMPPQLKLKPTASESGFLASTGTMQWSINPQCKADASAQLVQGEIRYSVKHSPGLDGLSRFTADVTVNGEIGKLVAEASGSNSVMTLDGSVGFGGKTTTTVATPKLSWDGDGIAIRVAASSGQFSEADGTATVSWEMPRAAASTTGGRYFVTGLKLDSSMNDIALGLGTASLSVKSVQLKDVEMTDFSMKSVSTEQNGSLDSVVTPTIKRIKAAGQVFEDVGLKISSSGLNAKSMRTLNEITKSGCGSEITEEATLLKLENAFAAFIDHGMKVGFTDIKAKATNGSVNGGFELALNSTAGGEQVGLADRFTATGNMKATGSLVPPEMGQVLIDMGFGQPVAGGGVQSSFSLKGGQLKVNGKPMDNGPGAQIGFMMQIADAKMTEWRDNLAAGESTFAQHVVALRQ